MTEIKVGPELDRAVAEAIGETVLSREQATEKWCDAWYEKWLEETGAPRGLPYKGWLSYDWYLDGEPDSGGLYPLPSYSEDLNDAFEAAEKVGLFHVDGYDALLGMNRGYWVVSGVRNDGIDVSAETPCLAICAAILEVARQRIEPVQKD